MNKIVKDEKQNNDLKAFKGMIVNAVIVLAVIWAAFTFFLGVTMVRSDDMKPRISAGDILVYYRIDKTPTAQDVIVFKKNGTEYVGRVVAVGGDKVEITEKDALIINDNMVIEDNIYFETPMYEGFVEYPMRISPGEYFVLADLRKGGEDSRYFGPVSVNEIKGTVIGQFRRSGI